MTTVDESKLSHWARAQQRHGTVATPAAPPLKNGGGNGTLDGMDPWAQSVETRLGQLHGDVRQVLYVTIACAVFLLGAGAVAYNRTDDNIRSLDSRVRSVETKLIEINGKLDVLIERTAPKS